MIKKYGLIGKNISYSLSPIIYTYWFNEYNIKANYELLDINEDEFNLKFLESLKTNNFYGLNITQPYKLESLKYLNNLSDELKNIQSCNNIVFKNDNIYGYNTDYIGLIESFKKIKINLKNKNILILGAGGSSYALIYALQILGVRTIEIANRNLDKIKNLQNIFPNIVVNDFKLNKNFDIVFNCSSVSFYEILNYFNLFLNINKKTIFYDFSYYNIN